MTPLLLFLLPLTLATPPTFTLNTTTFKILSDGPIHIHPSTFTPPTPATIRAYTSLFRPTAPITLSQNNLIFDASFGRVLVDTGAAGVQHLPLSAAAGKLSRSLELAGITPESIDVVLITHGHFDHVAGLTKDGRRMFENAKVYVGKREHSFWSAPTFDTDLERNTTEFLSAVYKKSVEPYLDSFVLVDDNAEPLPGIKFILTPGHTPGHNAIQITVGDRTLLVSGDAWISQPDQVRHPEWGYVFESDRDMAYESRIRLLQLAAEGGLVLSYHENFRGLGYVVRESGGFDWVPADVGKGEVDEDVGECASG